MIVDWNEFAKNLGYSSERDMMEDFYGHAGLSISEIANRLGAGTATISRRLNLLGVIKRTRGGPNNTGRQTYKLFHLDQRVVLRIDLIMLSRVTGISRSLCYKYRIARLRRKNAVLYTIPNQRPGTLLDVIDKASRAATSAERDLQKLLPNEEGEG